MLQWPSGRVVLKQRICLYDVFIHEPSILFIGKSQIEQHNSSKFWNSGGTLAPRNLAAQSRICSYTSLKRIRKMRKPLWISLLTRRTESSFPGFFIIKELVIF